MDFCQLVRTRQSDREYDSSRPVEKEKIERIIECARLAPSACNAQPWRFIVVDDPVLKNRIADTTSSKIVGMNHFTKQAPVHIIIVQESVNLLSGLGGLIKDKKFAPIDIGIAAAHITLAAADEGLGSCIVGWFDESKIKKILSIPSGKRVLLDIVIGYSLQGNRPKSRKELSKISELNHY